MSAQKPVITIEATVNVPVAKAWKLWNETEHVKKWNNASPDWHTPEAENDVRAGGKFNYRMEAKDGSFGFDFGGIYDTVQPDELIEYTLGDGRKVKNSFEDREGGKTHIVIDFEAESQNPLEMQKGGWQAILDNFKKYAESQS